jgi:hypothetical protein
MADGCYSRVMPGRYAGFAAGVLCIACEARSGRSGEEHHVNAGQSILVARTRILCCFSLALERPHHVFFDAPPSSNTPGS